MKATKETLENLISKMEWEGGLWMYIMSYGGEMPEEVKDEVDALNQASHNLYEKFASLLTEHDVDWEFEEFI